MEGTSEWAVARPAAALRPFVANYHGYRQTGAPPSVHRGLPSPYLTLVLTLDAPLVVAAHPDPAQAPGTYATLLGGLHTRPALIAQAGPQAGVQVSLHPQAARTLLGLPAGELAGLDVPADEVLGPDAARLREQLAAAPTWCQRFSLLDGALLARLGRSRAAAPAEVLHVWERLRATGGSVRVGELARETGWSTRHLGTVLRRETGLSPKAAARVVRFDRARREVTRRQGRELAAVAAASGYADQSHLDREFRAFTGLAPSRWWAEEFRNVQAPAAPDEPGWTHD